MQSEPETRSESLRTSALEELGLLPQRVDAPLDRLMQVVARLAQTAGASFWAVDRDRQFLAATASGSGSRDATARSALSDAVLRHDDVLHLFDAAQEPRFSADPLLDAAVRARGFAGLTVRGRDRERVGLLCLSDPQPRVLDAGTRAALIDGVALLEDRLRLRADVLHDPQTGAYARRHFEEMADREWRRAMRALVPVSVVVLELDRLSDFASREGAAALDRGLRAAALAVQYSLHRPGDCVCRFDDSRFVILLPGTDQSGAVETAERVRAALEALVIPFADAATGALTLSAGVQTVPSGGLSRTDLFQAVQAATLALRQAQQQGGNRWLPAGAVREALVG